MTEAASAMMSDPPPLLIFLVAVGSLPGRKTLVAPAAENGRLKAEYIVALAGADTSKGVVDFAANRIAATSPNLSQHRDIRFATHGWQ